MRQALPGPRRQDQSEEESEDSHQGKPSPCDCRALSRLRGDRPSLRPPAADLPGIPELGLGQAEIQFAPDLVGRAVAGLGPGQPGLTLTQGLDLGPVLGQEPA